MPMTSLRLSAILAPFEKAKVWKLKGSCIVKKQYCGVIKTFLLRGTGMCLEIHGAWMHLK